jgi:uncharacterized membrane protein
MTGLAQAPWRITRWRLALWGAIAALLLAPLVAMQFTTQVNWTALDFAVAGGLLVGAGLAFELVTRTVARPAWRLALAAAILAVVLVIWAQGAVGLI